MNYGRHSLGVTMQLGLFTRRNRWWRSIEVDIGILFSDHLLKMAALPQVDYAVAIMKAYSAWMIDR